jgi:cation:H+ antiporter
MLVSAIVTVLAMVLLWWGFRRGAMTAGRLALISLLYLCFCGWLLVM